MTHDRTPTADLPSDLEIRLYDILFLEDHDRRERELRELLDEHEDHRRELTTLIDHFKGAETALASGAAARSGGEPERVGPYRILQKLGAGGFGVVYLAEQEEPVRRLVALKLIPPGLDSHRVLSRFDAERQALAMMNHPGIANVLDAGQVSPSLSFFAMEYVDGVPITRACDLNGLDIESRLELFRKVCRAVQHTHLQGIIHRDLKPSNILVTDQDDKLVPKVIDFGIAKALDERLSEKQLVTEEGRFLGTPEYMSPEQAAGRNLDVRTDVYALAVLLYELVTGQLPHASEELRRGGLAETVRIICDTEVTRPSESLRRDPAAAAAAAECRSIDLAQLRRWVRGDLETIIMKGLRKDPEQRYGSVAQFDEDVRRLLAHEAVLAHPPALGYELRKFIRRHRIGVSVTLAALLAVITALIGTSWLLIEIEAAWGASVRREIEAKQNAYAANMAAAKAAIVSGDATAARRHLAASPHHLRGWEYDYLRARCDHSSLLIEGRKISQNGDYGGIRDFAITEAGTAVLTTYDGALEVWDLHRKVRTSHVPAIQSARLVALHPDGKSFATLTERGEVERWALPGGERIAVLRRQGEPTLHALAYSPQGVLVFGDRDGEIHVVEPGSDEIAYRLKGHSSRVMDVVFDRAGTRLLSAANTDAAVLWSLADRKQVRWFEVEPGKACAFSPDDSRVAFGGRDGRLHVFEVRSGNRSWTVNVRVEIMGVAFDPSGEQVLGVGGWASSLVGAWSTADGTSNGVWFGHASGVEAIAIDPAGRRFLTGSRDGTMRSWSLRPPRPVEVLRDDFYFMSMAVDRPRGRVVTGTDTGALTLRDCGSGEILRALRLGHRIRDVGLSADGTRLYLIERNRSIVSRDPQTLEPLSDRQLQGLEAPRRLAVDRHGANLAVATSAGEVALIDAATLRVRHIHPVRAHSISMTFHPKRDVLAVCGPDGWVVFYESGTGNRIDRVQIGGAGTSDCAFSDDGAQFASTGFDGTVRVLDTQNRTVRFVLNAGMSFVRGCSFAPDGARLASSHMDGSIRVWDLRSGLQVLALDGSMTDVAFGPSGRSLFACPAYDAPALHGKGLYVWRAPAAR